MPRETIKPAKIADSIALHLETLILEGVLRPGEKLLAERDLAERLDVSRPSLREALSKLESKGLLESGRDGTFVAHLVGASLTDPLAKLLESHPETTFDYLEFRQTVEGQAAYYAALRATDIDREALRESYERMEANHAKDDSDDEAEADTDLHLAIYEAAHNVVLLHIMRGLASMLRRDVFYNRTKLYSRKGVRDLLLTQHKAIFDAIIEGNPDAARKAAERHITFTLETIREIRNAEARLEASLRRVGRGDLIAAGSPRKGAA
jgi:GntR family transcriptional repressor for pyruvate dehydrogenase complex